MAHRAPLPLLRPALPGIVPAAALGHGGPWRWICDEAINRWGAIFGGLVALLSWRRGRR